MKKYLFLLLGAFVLTVSGIKAQRYAIIDTKYILNKIPDYVEAGKNCSC